VQWDFRQSKRHGLALCRAVVIFTNQLISQSVPWAPAGFFPGVGNEGVWRTEVLQQGSAAAPRWGSGGEASRSWRHFLKMMHKYFVYWGFRQHLLDKHFSTYPGGQVPPLPMPAGAHDLYINWCFRNRVIRIAPPLRVDVTKCYSSQSLSKTSSQPSQNSPIQARGSGRGLPPNMAQQVEL